MLSGQGLFSWICAISSIRLGAKFGLLKHQGLFEAAELGFASVSYMLVLHTHTLPAIANQILPPTLPRADTKSDALRTRSHLVHQGHLCLEGRRLQSFDTLEGPRFDRIRSIPFVRS